MGWPKPDVLFLRLRRNDRLGVNNVMALAPIALFVYNRPKHTVYTVEALLRNTLANESDLFIFSDAPRKPSQSGLVNSVRKYIHDITGFKSVTIVERDTNKGLANSIIDGVSRLCQKFGQVVVLEDDLVTSQHFLSYVNKSLNVYRYNDKVISIHGYMYPVKSKLPESFFLRGADCWGWATWDRGWNLFEPNRNKLLHELKDKNMIKQFNYNGAFNNTKMLNESDSWGIRWHASAFLKNKLTLYPGVSLVNNIGLDGTGVHCGTTHYYDCEVSKNPIEINDIAVTDNEEVRRLVEEYLRNIDKPVVNRIKNKIRKFSNKYI
jgi:hypothetical protein